MTSATLQQPVISWEGLSADPLTRPDYHEAVRQERQLRHEVETARAIMNRYGNNVYKRVIPAKRHEATAQQLLATILNKDVMVLSYIDFESLRELVHGLSTDFTTLEQRLAAKREANAAKSRRHASNRAARVTADIAFRTKVKGHNPSADSFSKKGKKKK